MAFFGRLASGDWEKKSAIALDLFSFLICVRSVPSSKVFRTVGVVLVC